jgi:CheY-like chemotaxis protein
MSDQILVLVAEDEDLVRLVIVEALEDAGFEVFEAGHAEAALGVLQSHAARIHVLCQRKVRMSPGSAKLECPFGVRQGEPLSASQANSSAAGRGQAPWPQSGASQTPALRLATSRETIEIAVGRLF